MRTNRYSVQARLIGRRVQALLHASHLVIYDGHAEVARHGRLPFRSGARLDLDHYLEALAASPARCPAPPHWNKPAPQANSPRSTAPGGPRPAKPTATQPAPALIEVLRGPAASRS